MSAAHPNPALAQIPSTASGGSVAESASWAFLALVVTIGLGSARALVAARLLNAEQLGAMGIALLVLATVDALTATGADTALVSNPGDVEDDLDPAFTLRAIQGFVIAALLWAVAAQAGRFFDLPGVSGLIRALALVPILRGISNPAAILLVKRIEFRRLFWWGLPESCAGILLVVGVGLVRRDVWALVAAVVGAQLVATLISYLMAPRGPRFRLRGPAFRRLLYYARWIQGTRLLMFAALNLDTFMVGKLLGTTALGFYQLAFRLGEIPIATIGQAAARVTLPVLTRLQREPMRLRREYFRIAGLVTGAASTFAIGVFVAAEPGIHWLLGPQWLPLVPILRILTVAMIFRGVLIIATELFYAVGRPKYAFLANGVRLGVMAISIYPLLIAYEARGVAGSVLLSSLAAAMVCVAGIYMSVGMELKGGPAILPSPLGSSLARHR